MTGLVGYLLLFVAVGVGFILVHLLAGMLLRPIKPDVEKLAIYECGEDTIGSAWVQFDLRFYVVALLFVIFDVEVAFFFPWAVVFGKFNELARLPAPQTIAQREAYNGLVRELVPNYPENRERLGPYQTTQGSLSAENVAQNQEAAHTLAWIAFADIAVFFGVLLVGFAYLWKRGDLNWVRSVAAEQVKRPAVAVTPPAREPAILVGAGSH